MNPLGIHALVWAGGWSEPECEEALTRTKESGFDFIEIPLLDPWGVSPEITRRFLRQTGLFATCSLGLSFDADVSSEDAAVSERGERLLHRAVEVTAAMGASYLGGVVYSAMDKYRLPASARSRSNCIEALARVARFAATQGVTIGIEPVNRYESNICNTVAQALSMIDHIGADNLVVHLDSYHANIEEGDLETPVITAGSRLGYVHVGESHRGYLGSGTIDFGSFFRALARVGYDGPIAFESFSSVVISREFSSALAVWRDLWDDNVHLARHARGFIEGQIEAARGSV